ncbi:protease [Lithospermum erythrorhizon]|uniref:Protease n=1 Tax=Lithospermum erythrorhizon TaxID=34254 RepID=A0AAV3NYI9_LITER
MLTINSAVNQGAALLLSGSNPATRHVIDAAFDTQQHNKQLAALHALANIIGETRAETDLILNGDAEEILKRLIYEMASRTSKLTPSGLLLSILKQDSEIRVAGYRVLGGLVARPWCLLEVVSRREIVDIVADPYTETDKIGMEARHKCCQAIFKAFTSSPKIMGEPALAGIASKLEEAMTRGPFLGRKHVEAQPAVMTADRFYWIWVRRILIQTGNLVNGKPRSLLPSPEDDHKNRKGRSRARRETKSRKKKVRRRSSSPESNPRKRKRSKKDVKLRSRKKSRKDKRKSDLSLSSASESQSFSSCPGLSSNSSEEREPRRKRGRSRESKKHRRDPSKAKTKKRSSRSKSPSCSYSGDIRHTHNVSHGEEEIATEYKSKRLRSVISVVKRQEEENISDKDPYEEEMLYDRYDYPSSRSNDSYDGVSKIESAYHSNMALDKTETEGNETIEKEGLAEYDITDGAIREAEIEHGDISSVVSEPTEDNELLLRQKALENLRKFLVEKQRNLKTKVSLEGQSETRVIQSSAAKTRDVHEFPMKLNNSSEQNPATYVKAKNSCSTPSDTNTSHSVRVECESSYGENTGGDPVPSILNGNNQTSEIFEKGKDSIATLDVNVILGSPTSASRQKSVASDPAMKQRPSSQAHRVSNSGISPARSPYLTPSLKSNLAIGVAEGVSSSTGNGLKVSETTSGEKISTEQQDQSKDGSQYEKKTMSVMRGGEMVQVSYKVYIPKKTPALHRRQLRR